MLASYVTELIMAIVSLLMTSPGLYHKTFYGCN